MGWGERPFTRADASGALDDLISGRAVDELDGEALRAVLRVAVERLTPAPVRAIPPPLTRADLDAMDDLDAVRALTRRSYW